MKKYELTISEKLLDAVNQYLYEIEDDGTNRTSDLNEFIIQAIVEKFNKENDIYRGKIDNNGFTDGKPPIEHYLNIK